MVGPIRQEKQRKRRSKFARKKKSLCYQTKLRELKGIGATDTVAIRQLQTEPIVSIERMDPTMYGGHPRDYRYDDYAERNRNYYIGNKYRRRWRDDHLDVWGPNYDDDDDDHNRRWFDYAENQNRYADTQGSYRRCDTPYPTQGRGSTPYNYNWPPRETQRPSYEYGGSRSYAGRGKYSDYNWKPVNNRGCSRNRPSSRPNNIALLPPPGEKKEAKLSNDVSKKNEESAKEQDKIRENESLLSKSPNPVSIEPSNKSPFGQTDINVQSEQPAVPEPSDFTNISVDVPAAAVYLEVPMEFSDDDSDIASEILTITSINTNSSFMDINKQTNSVTNQDCDRILPNVNISDSASVKCDQNVNKSENSTNSIRIDKTKIVSEESKIDNKKVDNVLEKKDTNKRSKLPFTRKNSLDVDAKLLKASDKQKTDCNDNNINNNRERTDTPLKISSKPSPKVLKNMDPNSSISKNVQAKDCEKKITSEVDQKSTKSKTSRWDSKKTKQQVEAQSNITQSENVTDNAKNNSATIMLRRKSVVRQEQLSEVVNTKMQETKKVKEKVAKKKDETQTKMTNVAKESQQVETQSNITQSESVTDHAKNNSASIMLRRKSVVRQEQPSEVVNTKMQETKKVKEKVAKKKDETQTKMTNVAKESQQVETQSNITQSESVTDHAKNNSATIMLRRKSGVRQEQPSEVVNTKMQETKKVKEKVAKKKDETQTKMTNVAEESLQVETQSNITQSESVTDHAKSNSASIMLRRKSVVRQEQPSEVVNTKMQETKKVKEKVAKKKDETQTKMTNVAEESLQVETQSNITQSESVTDHAKNNSATIMLRRKSVVRQEQISEAVNTKMQETKKVKEKVAKKKDETQTNVTKVAKESQKNRNKPEKVSNGRKSVNPEQEKNLKLQKDGGSSEEPTSSTAKITKRKKSIVPSDEECEMQSLEPQTTNEESNKAPAKISRRRKTIASSSTTNKRQRQSCASSIPEEDDSPQPEIYDRSQRAKSEGRVTRSKSQEFGLNLEALPLPRERATRNRSRSRSRSRPREVVSKPRRKSVSRKYPETDEDSDASSVSYKSCSSSENGYTKKRGRPPKVTSSTNLVDLKLQTNKNNNDLQGLAEQQKRSDPRIRQNSHHQPPQSEVYENATHPSTSQPISNGYRNRPSNSDNTTALNHELVQQPTDLLNGKHTKTVLERESSNRTEYREKETILNEQAPKKLQDVRRSYSKSNKHNNKKKNMVTVGQFRDELLSMQPTTEKNTGIYKKMEFLFGCFEFEDNNTSFLKNEPTEEESQNNIPIENGTTRNSKRKLSLKGDDDSCSSSKKAALPWDHGLRQVPAVQRRHSTINSETSTKYNRRPSTSQASSNLPIVDGISSSGESSSKNVQQRRSSNARLPAAVGRVNSNLVDPRKLSMERRLSISSGNISPKADNDMRKLEKRRPSATVPHSSTSDNSPGVDNNGLQKVVQKRPSSTTYNINVSGDNGVKKLEQRRASSITCNNPPGVDNKSVKKSEQRRSSCNNPLGVDSDGANKIEQRRPSSSGINRPGVQNNSLLEQRRPSITQCSSSTGSSSSSVNQNDPRKLEHRRPSCTAQSVSTDTRNLEDKSLSKTNEGVLKGHMPARQSNIINSLQRRLSTGEPSIENNIEKPAASLKSFVDYKMKRSSQRQLSVSELNVQNSNNDNSITLNVTNNKNENYIVHMTDKVSNLLKEQCYATSTEVPEFISEATIELEVDVSEPKTAHKYTQSRIERKLQKVLVNKNPPVVETAPVHIIEKAEKDIVNSERQVLEVIDLLSSDDESEIIPTTDQIKHVESINNLMRQVQVFDKPISKPADCPTVNHPSVSPVIANSAVEPKISTQLLQLLQDPPVQKQLLQPTQLNNSAQVPSLQNPNPVQPHLPNPTPQIQESHPTIIDYSQQEINVFPGRAELTVTMTTNANQNQFIQTTNTISVSSGNVTVLNQINEELANNRVIPAVNSNVGGNNQPIANVIPQINANIQPPGLPVVTHNDAGAALGLYISLHWVWVKCVFDTTGKYKHIGIPEASLSRDLPELKEFPEMSLNRLTMKFLAYFSTYRIEQFEIKKLFRCIDYYLNAVSKFDMPVRFVLFLLYDVSVKMKEIFPNPFTNWFFYSCYDLYKEVLPIHNLAVRMEQINQQRRQQAAVMPCRSGPAQEYAPQPQRVLQPVPQPQRVPQPVPQQQPVQQPQPFTMLAKHKAILMSQIQKYLKLCVYMEPLKPQQRRNQRQRPQASRNGGSAAGPSQGLQMPSGSQYAAVPAPPSYSTALSLLNQQVSSMGRPQTSNNMQQTEHVSQFTRPNNNYQNIDLAGLNRYVPPPNVTVTQAGGIVTASSTYLPPIAQTLGTAQQSLALPCREVPELDSFPVPNDNYRIRLPLLRPFEPPATANSSEQSMPVIETASVLTSNQISAISTPATDSVSTVTTTSAAPLVKSESSKDDNGSNSLPPIGFVKCESIENEVIDVDLWFKNRLQQAEEEPTISYNVKAEMIHQLETDSHEEEAVANPVSDVPVSEHVPPPRIASVDSGISSPPGQIEHPEIMLDRICICSKKAELVCQCKMAIYCSRECQVNNWPNHQNICLQSRKE